MQLLGDAEFPFDAGARDAGPERRAAHGRCRPARRAAMVAGAVALRARLARSGAGSGDSAAGAGAPRRDRAAYQRPRRAARSGARCEASALGHDDPARRARTSCAGGRRPIRPCARCRSRASFPSTLADHGRRSATPVAALTSPDGRRLAVAADGTLLPRAAKEQAAGGAGRPRCPRTAGSAGACGRSSCVLGGAPAALRPLLDRVWQAPDGVRVGAARRAGAPLRLDPSAAARPSGQRRRACWPRASHGRGEEIDVRLPERPGRAASADPRPRTTARARRPEPPRRPDGRRVAPAATHHGGRPTLNPESRVTTLQCGSRVRERLCPLSCRRVARVGKFAYGAESTTYRTAPKGSSAT